MGRWLILALLLPLSLHSALAEEPPEEAPPFPIQESDIPADMPERMKADQRSRLHRAAVAYHIVWGKGQWVQGSSSAAYDAGAQFREVMVRVGYAGWRPSGQNLYDIQRQVAEEMGTSRAERELRDDIEHWVGERSRLPCIFSKEQPSNTSYANCVERFQEVNAKWLSENAPYGWRDLFEDILRSPFVRWLR